MLAVSLALHVALVVGIGGRNATPPRTLDTQVVTLEFVELEALAPTQVPDSAKKADAPASTDRATRQVRAVSRQAPPSPDTAPPTASNDPDVDFPVVAANAHFAIAEDETLEGGSVARARDTPSATPTISALDAARSLLPLDQMPSVADVAAAKLDAALACAANSRPHLSRRGPPELRRGADGSYTHEAPGFFATIHRDGHVTFARKPPAELRLSTTFLSVETDITDAMLEAMGEELYPAEKHRFMEQTRELREQLEADDRLHLFARARGELLKTLAAIAANTHLSWAEKHDAVLTLWADCAEDEVGARGRQVIESFVRDHFQAGSENAFTYGELQRFNQRNASGLHFDPYRPSQKTAR